MASSLSTEIDEALSRIDYPSKDALWKHIQIVGRSNSRNFPKYLFLPRGGLSSPYVKYITDVDMIFNKRKGEENSGVSEKEFDALQKMVKKLCGGLENIMSAKVSIGDQDLFDGEAKDLNEVRACTLKGADVVNIAGSYKLANGWRVPIDFTLQHGDQKMSKEARMARVMVNLKDGNYAKVVQRLRAMLGKGTKEKFAEKWNEMGGALRFLVKQLEVVRLMKPAVREQYMSSRLHLSSERSYEEWAAAADAEMQKRARNLLLCERAILERTLGSIAEPFCRVLDDAPGVAKAEAAEEATAPTTPERKGQKRRLADVLMKGTEVKAKSSSDGEWYKASVLKVRKTDAEASVKVRFEGCGSEDDEWLGLDSLRGKALKGLREQGNRGGTAES